MTIGLALSKTPGYSETFFISKIKGLINSGFDVILFVQKKDPEFTLCAVKQAPKVFKKNALALLLNMLFVFGKLSVTRPKRIYRFIKLERKTDRAYIQILKNIYNNAHFLHANLDWLHFGFATMALNSENVAEVIGAKMAISLRGYDISIYPVKHYGCYDILWTKVDKIHTISNDLLEIAYGLGLSKKVPYLKITPAIDVEFFEQELPKDFGQPIKIATVARLHWKKGIIYTLEALKRINSFDYEYTIIGEGSEYQEISFAIYQLGLSKNVLMVGLKNKNEIKTLLSQTDIYLQYSISEGFCNAVIEAQALGLLCITSDAEGLSENVMHEKTGWIVPKRSSELLAKRIEEVIKLPQEQKEIISTNAINRIKTQFNLKKQELEFKAFYE